MASIFLHPLSIRTGIALLLAGIVAATAGAAETPANPPDCRDVAAAAERQNAIPTRLLAAISLAEAGRWDRDRAAWIAWPWTVHAEGRGHYLPDKAAAVAMVRRLQARGVRNIDVGCMQVNLKYHPRAFASLEQALDPHSNVAFAARFLSSLRRDHRSWSKAVGHYHSATRKLNRPYRRKVLRLWHKERWRYFKARHAAARLAVVARRQQRRPAPPSDERGRTEG